MAVSKLASGLNYLAGYKRGKHESLNHSNFRGFKVGAVVYSNLKSMKQAFGVKNLRDLESEVDRFDVGSVTAEWYNIEEGYSWSAYLWEGAFRVGTSAYRLFCKTVEERVMENNKAMNLYIINEVLCDHTPGMIVIAAENIGHAREIFMDNKKFVRELSDFNAAIRYGAYKVIEGVNHPEGVVSYVYGGG